MYGYHDLPLRIERDMLEVSVEKEGDTWLYKRKCLDSTAEKILLANGSRILLNPVEPLNRPKAITPYLLVRFDKPLILEPGSKKKIFVTFPIELGVYVSVDKNLQVLDTFTMAPEKFTLYGEPSNGIICKRWKSPVYSTMPLPDPLREGIMELNLANVNQEWVEINKAVFNAYGMKIYYDEKIVAMKDHMKLLSVETAETDFEDTPLQGGMKKSLEIYTARKLLISTSKFLMEHGI